MSDFRSHGRPPYRLVLLHGGPGARGEMTVPARRLANRCGVLELLQTATSVDGQRREVGEAMQANAALPATLLGFSWGAWLACIVAACHPECVKKLVLVGSGPFSEEYVAAMQKTRIARLNQSAQAELLALGALASPTDKEMARMGAIYASADAFDPLPDDAQTDCRLAVFAGVWPEAASMRRSGELLALASQIRCPVVAIHGDYDPHPAAGVERPLSAVVADFRFVLLKNCGHKPWLERQAQAEFYRVVEGEID